ncbi:tRNA pseudouridine(55) synthase TruB [Kallotenue papyrolyticum]|uniref:tRNA pseudouridine(55) synthase TruB n=1 Tax=Kallotenue papyrolyticum TaxID=1325125 RepID=UPI0004B7FDA9|nr:tRNA pseudouridine(55) synthase TruB [Kallotenue papyrolyticum]
MPIHGFLNIDKPTGLTSHDVVARVRRLVGQRRVGHGGTLDPPATGVLPIGLGEATRLLPYLVEGRKTYQAVVRLGVTTTTDDATGEPLATRPVPPLTEDELRQALAQFEGLIEQVPPMYSAVRIDGRRLYELARRGEEVARAPRTVEIERIELLSWQPPLLTLVITCGKGTYIRALARDLGAALGCGAHVQALRRTQVGALTLETAVPLAALEAEPRQLAQALLPPDVAVADWPRVDLDASAAQRVANGLPVPRTLAVPRARAHGPDGRLLALLAPRGEHWQPMRVFRWST